MMDDYLRCETGTGHIGFQKDILLNIYSILKRVGYTGRNQGPEKN